MSRVYFNKTGMTKQDALSQEALLEISRNLRFFSKDLIQEAHELRHNSKKIREARLFIAASTSRRWAPLKFPFASHNYILQTEPGSLTASQLLKALRISRALDDDLRRGDFDFS